MRPYTILALSLVFLAASGFQQAVAQGIPGGGQGGQSGLNLTGITLSDENPMEGEEVSISVVLTNGGPRSIDNVTVSFQLDSRDTIGNVTAITIEVNESKVITVPWIAEKWDHVVTGMIIMNGAPLMDRTVSAEIAVGAEPIGDVQSLFLTLGFIMLAVIAVIVAPSLWFRIRT